MSRLFRPFSSLFRSRSSRALSRLPSGQTVRIEWVKIGRRESAARFLGTVLKGALAFELVMIIVPLIFDADTDKHGGQNRRQATEALGGYVRSIPLPLTTRRLPDERYSPHGPELAEFNKLLGDEKLKDAIADHLCSRVQRFYSAPKMASHLGAPVKVRRHRLECHPLLFAPPAYERSVILLTPKGLEWATERCEPDLVARLKRILWPEPLGLGFWALGKAAIKLAAADVTGYLLFGSAFPKPLPTSGPELLKALEQIRERQRATKRPAEVDETKPAPPSIAVLPNPAPPTHDKAPGVLNKPEIYPGASAATPGQPSWWRELHQSIRTIQPWRTFLTPVLRAWQLPTYYAPRGAIVVGGIVEMETPRAWIHAEIYACYDPKTKMIDGASVHFPRQARVIWKTRRLSD